MPCFSRVETSQLIYVKNRTTGFYVGLTLVWKKLNSYPYYLAIVNMLFFDCRFVICFKNVKILPKCEFQRVEL